MPPAHPWGRGTSIPELHGAGAVPSPHSHLLHLQGAQIDKTPASPWVGATEIQELREDTKMDSDFNFSKTSILRSLLLALKVDLLLSALQMIY